MRRLIFLTYFVVCLAVGSAAFFAAISGVPQTWADYHFLVLFELRLDPLHVESGADRQMSDSEQREKRKTQAQEAEPLDSEGDLARRRGTETPKKRSCCNRGA